MIPYKKYVLKTMHYAESMKHQPSRAWGKGKSKSIKRAEKRSAKQKIEEVLI